MTQRQIRFSVLMWTRLHRSMLAPFFALWGCSDPVEHRYSYDRLELATDFEHPVCNGTLTMLGEHIKFVETTLQRPLVHGARIRLHWITDELEPWCGSHASGCYYPGTRIAFAKTGSLKHELVHAVLNAPALTNVFLEEALAEAVAGRATVHNPRSSNRSKPAELIWLSPKQYRNGDLDYRVAAHFMRYLIARSSNQSGAAYMADIVTHGQGPSELRRVFRDRLGATFEAIEAEYIQKARPHYPGLRESLIAQIPTESPRNTNIDLHCSAPSTMGPLPDGTPGMYRTMRFRLLQDSRVIMDFRASPGTRMTIAAAYRPGYDDGPLDFEIPRLQGRDAQWIVDAPASAIDLALARGDYLVVVSRSDYEATAARIQSIVWPTGDEVWIPNESLDAAD